VRALAVLALLALPGCAELQAAAPPASREACYNAAAAQAADRASHDCAATGWDACPARDAIMNSLRDAQKGCP
jgi:hypothetical protein